MFPIEPISFVSPLKFYLNAYSLFAPVGYFRVHLAHLLQIHLVFNACLLQHLQVLFGDYLAAIFLCLVYRDILGGYV